MAGMRVLLPHTRKQVLLGPRGHSDSNKDTQFVLSFSEQFWWHVVLLRENIIVYLGI